MKLIIFAGGIGTRLWPLSRENSPKQFDRIFAGKSTLELAIERLETAFSLNDIFIQTQDKYFEIIRQQVPGLPAENIILEPARKNLAPAVCFAMVELKKRGFKGPVAILWADHLMENILEFTMALKIGEKLIEENPDRFIFLAEQSRFANNNLGWIKIGEKLGEIENKSYHSFAGWKYRPAIQECLVMHQSPEYFWNPGYFITSLEFLLKKYQELAPEIYQKVVTENYHLAEELHFDQAIIEKVDLSQAVVILTEMGWSDPGTLYALKEALAEDSEANVIYGKVTTLETKDSLIYNLEKEKLVATIGLEGMVIVNTPDALIVVPKEEVVKISKLIEKMKQEGLTQHL